MFGSEQYTLVTLQISSFDFHKTSSVFHPKNEPQRKKIGLEILLATVQPQCLSDIGHMCYIFSAYIYCHDYQASYLILFEISLVHDVVSA